MIAIKQYTICIEGKKEENKKTTLCQKYMWKDTNICSDVVSRKRDMHYNNADPKKIVHKKIVQKKMRGGERERENKKIYLILVMINNELVTSP